MDGKLKHALKSLRLSDSCSLGDETLPTDTFGATSGDVSITLSEHSFGKLAENRSGSQIRLDSESSDEDEHHAVKKESTQTTEETSTVDATCKENASDHRSLNLDQSAKPASCTLKSPVDPVDPNSELNQPTMWLGTEDGW